MNEQNIKKGLIQQLLGAGQAVGNFFAPTITKAGGIVADTIGAGGDYVKYQSGNQKKKLEAAKSYTQRKKRLDDAFKSFGFDSTKSAGEQFSPTQFAKKTLQGAGEGAMLASPVKGSFSQRFLANAVPGATRSMGEGDNVGDIIMNAAGSGVLGAGGSMIGKAAGKLGEKLGQKLASKGKEFAIKGSRITSPSITKFRKETGEDLAEFVINRKINKPGTQQVGELIETSQNSFDDIARKSGKKFNILDVQNKLMQKAKELSQSTFDEDINMGQKLSNYAQRLGDKFKNNAVIDISDLTNERVSADKLTKKFALDPSSKGLNQVIRDNLQDFIQEGTSDLKVDGKSLKDIGLELRKLYSYKNLAEKAADAGKGNLPIGLIPSITGMGGLGLGGLLGGGPIGSALTGLASAGGAAIMNSPQVISKASKAMMSGGQKLTNIAQNESLNKIIQKGGQIAGQKGGELLNNLIFDKPGNETNANTEDYSGKNQLSQENNIHNPNLPQGQQASQGLGTPEEVSKNFQEPQLTAFTGGDGNTYNVDKKTGEIYSAGKEWKWSDETNDWVPSGVGKQPNGGENDQLQQMFKAALINDLMTTGGQRVAEISTVYKLLFPEQKKAEAKKDKALSASAQQVIGKANAGLKALDRIEKNIVTDQSVLIKSLIPGSPGARQYEADVSSLTDALGGLRTGATVSKEQQAFYRNMLPKIGDSPETIKSKIQAVRDELRGYTQLKPDVLQTEQALPNIEDMQLGI